MNPALWRKLRTRKSEPLPSGVYEFPGGMSLEIPFYGARRLNATSGFSLLRLSAEGFWLGTTTSAIPRNRRSVEYRKSDVVEVFLTHGLTVRGVGLATMDGKTHYFWAFRRSRVLEAFAALGYPVGQSRRARGVLVDQIPLPWRRSS